MPAVRTGAPAYHTLFGRPFWEDLQAHPQLAADFDALMGPAGHGTPDPEVLVSGGWEAVRSVVDVGGGSASSMSEPDIMIGSSSSPYCCLSVPLPQTSPEES